MLNKVMLIGNLGRDPEVRTLESGKSVATLSIATSKKWKSADGEKQERTEWHRVVSFADTLNSAVITPYVKKGNRVYIEGELQTRKWTEENGNVRYTTEIIINQFNGVLTMLGDRSNSVETNKENTPHPTTGPYVPDDNIPF